MPTDADSIAHVLRRCTFGPTDRQWRRFEGSTPAEVVDALLTDPTVEVPVPRLGPDDDDAYDRAFSWWLDRLRADDGGGLAERMVWFWHGHLTSSIEKADPGAMARQIQLLRAHAFGNFRTLLHEVTTDPAMLYWLDGSGSTAAAPNENYARELMELFALGRDSGAYGEEDVRAGAKALAGWWVVDWDDEADRPLDVPFAVFEPEDGLRGAVDFLGRRVRTAADVVDAVCDHPACAPFVVGELHEYFVGAPPTDDRRAELASLFREADLEVRPVVESILRHPSFLDAIGSRPRSPLEWYFAFERLVGAEVEFWILEELGQLPLNPPNVAGWPDPERWLAGGAVITKAQIAIDHSWDTATLDAGDPVADILGRAGLADVGPTTRQALDAIADDEELGRRERASLLHAVIALSPEFNVI